MKNFLDYALTETLSPEEFLQVLQTERTGIEDVEFIMPDFGTDSFGKFRVKFRYSHLIQDLLSHESAGKQSTATP